MALLRDLLKIDYFKTLWINYVLFGFKGICIQPIMVGRRTQIKGVRRGSISIDLPMSQWKTGFIRLGISQGDTYAEHGLYSLVSLQRNCKIIFTGGGKTKIYGGCSLILRGNGVLYVGKDCIINQRTLICAHRSIKIGDYVNVGWGCQIYDTNFHLVYDASKNAIRNPMREVVIGHNSWLGNHVTIAKGAVLPPFSIVSAMSLVNKDFSANKNEGSIYAGIPAKLIKDGGYFRIRNRLMESALLRRFSLEQLTCLEMDKNFDYLNNCLES